MKYYQNQNVTEIITRTIFNTNFLKLLTFNLKIFFSINKRIAIITIVV